jgi:hypothetical protein
MKKKFLVLLLCGFLMEARAQAGWTRRDSGDPNGLHSVIWAGSTTSPQPGAKLVAAARFTFTILTSPDGAAWTLRETDNTGGAGSGYQGLAWVGNQAIALSWADSRILTSPDGITWTTRLSGPEDTVGIYPTAAASSGSRIVVVCQGGKALTSPDGIAWTGRFTGTEANFTSLAWTGSQFVAVGEAGAVFTSPDGTQWTARNAGTTWNLYGILWTGTQLVAVGEAGTILTSANGIQWTARASGTLNSLNAVTWTGSQIVTAGSDPSGRGNNVVLASTDGVAWTGKSLGIPEDLNGITWTGSQLVIVGQHGGVWTAPQSVTAVRSGREANFPALRRVGSRLVVNLPDFLKTGKVVVTIYGLTGDRMGEFPVEASQKSISVSTESLPQGAYFLEIRGGGGWRTWPFHVSR